MTETRASTHLANLPPLSGSADVRNPRLLQAWLKGPGRWVGWLVIPLVPLFIFSTVMVSEIMGDACFLGINPDADHAWNRYVYDQGCLQNTSLTMGAVSLLYVIFGALCLASAVAVLRRPKSVLNGPEAAARLQGIKDWFIRGDITEEDYDALRRLINSVDENKSPALLARRGATLLRSLAWFLLPLGAFWFTFIGIFIDVMNYSNDELSYILNWLIGGLLLVAMFIACMIRAAQLGRFSRGNGTSLLRQIDEAEESVMRAARARSGHRSPTAEPSGASFRAYSRR